MQAIPVTDGQVIEFNSVYRDDFGDETYDRVTITIKQEMALPAAYQNVTDVMRGNILRSPDRTDSLNVLTFARGFSGVTDEQKEAYYNSLCNYYQGQDKVGDSECASVAKDILGLTALGYDVTDSGGKNLLDPFNTTDYTNNIQRRIYTLLAFDSGNYDFPKMSGITALVLQQSRDKLVSKILDAEVSGTGGWGPTATSTEYDFDWTILAICALAPYYEDNAKVQAAVDRAFDLIATLQDDTGAVHNATKAYCKNTALTIKALCAVGIDPLEDERFVKPNGNLITALDSFAFDGFFRMYNDAVTTNSDCSLAAYDAMTAYGRFCKGMNGLYEMGEEKAPVVAGLEVIAPIKTDYLVGEELDLTGASVRVIYQKHQNQTVELTEEMLGGFDLSEGGSYSVSVTYGGYTLEDAFTIDVSWGDAVTVSRMFSETGDYQLSRGEATFGDEWRIFGLARAGVDIPEEIKEEYIDDVVCEVIDTLDGKDNGRLHNTKSTENARTALALTALGVDATNIEGFDIVSPLMDLTWVSKQGANGPIWALITLNLHDFPIEGIDEARAELVEKVLSLELENGGWALSGSVADPDMTGMAIQSLAPFVQENADVRAAVNRALDALSALQTEKGGFRSAGSENLESTAQVVVALTELGINPAEDPRFIQNGNTLFDAMAEYFVDGGGFRHVADGKINAMATDQGYYALASIMRLKNDQTSLYNMRDVAVSFLQVESVEISNLPADQTYVKGHDKKINLGDAVVVAKMNDGTTREIELSDDMCAYSLNQLGEQVVTVTADFGTFGVFTTSFTINVIRTLDQIAVAAPTKVEYFPGDVLDLSGAKLGLIYSDGTTEEIALTEAMLSGFDLNTVGTYAVKVSYEGLTIEEAFTITVNAVEAVSLEIVELPAKTEYLVGETLDLTGVVLLLSYNNGDAKAFSMTDAEVKLIGCEAGVLDHTGSFELTFEVEGVKTQEAVIIRVLSAEVSRIEIVEMPENLDYTVGDELNLTGGVIRVFYNNGETGDIAMNDAQIKLIGCDTGVLNSVGEFTVSVEFAGYQSPNSFVVTVKAPYVVAVEIEEEPARYQFGLEDKIHFGEGTLKLIYNNGSEEIISMNDARVACAGLGEDVLSADAILLQEGQFEVRFAVDGIETEGAFAFEVLHAKKVAITAMPEHKAFHLGDDIDLTGGIITVELEDGTIKEVDMNDPNAIKHVLKLQEMDLSDITEPSVYEVRFEYRGLMADESIILTIVPQGEDLPEEDVTPDDGDVDDDGNDDVTPDDGDVDDDVTDDVIPDDGDDEDGETPDDGDVDDTTPDDGDEDVTDDATPDDGDVDDDVEDDVTPDDGDVEDGDVDDTTPDDGDDDEITDDVTPDNGDVDDDTKDDEVLGDVAGDVTDSDDADVEDEVLVDVEDPAAAADGELTEGETESTIAEIITAISENPATGIIAITGGMILALIGGAVVVIRKLK